MSLPVILSRAILAFTSRPSAKFKNKKNHESTFITLINFPKIFMSRLHVVQATACAGTSTMYKYLRFHILLIVNLTLCHSLVYRSASDCVFAERSKTNRLLSVENNYFIFRNSYMFRSFRTNIGLSTQCFKIR